jgi:ADP-heptose:LPS heptosyltransferase
MRWVDRWLGVPLRAALTVHRWVAGRWRRPPEAVKRIVLVKLAEQGSTVLAYAAIRRATELVGRENVFFLVFEENRFILDLLDLIPPANILTIPTGGTTALARGLIAAIRRMRREEIDAAVDLEFFARSSAALCYLGGASRRAGFHAWDGGGPWRGDLMTHRLSYNPHLHTSVTFVMQVESLTVPPQQLPAMDVALPNAECAAPQARFTVQQVNEAKAILRPAAGRDDLSDLVLLNPNCSDMLPLRKWPEERYVQVARLLLDRYPQLHIAFTGAPGEEAAAARLVGQVGSERCFSIAGRTTLEQLVVLYSLAKVLVTNDSGPAHFATLTPVEVVTLFGPETPRLFAARSERNHVLWAGLPCSPCVSAYNNRNSACPNNLCMQSITVEQVVEQVCVLLDRYSAASRACVDDAALHEDAAR